MCNYKFSCIIHINEHNSCSVFLQDAIAIKLELFRVRANKKPEIAPAKVTSVVEHANNVKLDFTNIPRVIVCILISLSLKILLIVSINEINILDIFQIAIVTSAEHYPKFVTILLVFAFAKKDLVVHDVINV